MRKRQFNRKLFFLILTFVSTCFFKPLYSQVVYTHVSSEGIHSFLDELASEKIIQINSTVKPYERREIAQWLKQAVDSKEKLNERQKKELDFYLLDYGKELHHHKNFKRRHDLFYYADSMFSFTLNPILGIQYFVNDSGNFYHRWNGAEVFGYAGKNLGVYASLRDNHESKILSDPSYLSPRIGADYKNTTGSGGDFSEMRGGISYSWEWGNIGAVKDHFQWGDNHHGSNIFSGRTPSFPHLKLRLNPVRWFDFNYVHGWLVSNVIDSSKIYYSNNRVNRLAFRPKYLAANLATVTPFKDLNISIGNSIIYSDQDVNLAYLIPVFFYKSVDHNQSSTGSDELGQNSQMFFSISSRNIKHLHIYTSWFIDELSFSNALDSKKQSNHLSAKFGFQVRNLFVPNLFFTGEYTRNNPIVYRHYVETSTYANDLYNLGHYLGDNAREIYFDIGYKPIRALSFSIAYALAQKGETYLYDGRSGTSGSGKGNPFLKGVLWESNSVILNANYAVLNDVNLALSIESSEVDGIQKSLYTNPLFAGRQTTFSFLVGIGF